MSDLRASHGKKGKGLRLLPLLLLGSLAVSGCTPSAPPAAEVLHRACGYLWDQQADDGGWHSQSHGLLRGGQVWTAYILYQLLETPAADCPRPPGGAERGLTFIRQHLNAAGTLGLADPDVLEYPNYATGYALRLLARHGTAADTTILRRMSVYLLDQQFREARGIGPDHPAYGGWGFGEPNLLPGQVGHIDLSHTRRTLQALRMAGTLDAAAAQRALHFMGLVQKHPTHPSLKGLDAEGYYDGGFYASPVVLAVNKSKPLPVKDLTLFESYATATADGLLALLAIGAAETGTRIPEAKAWLQAHEELDHPQGMNLQDPNQWQEVLVFYHLTVRAEAYAALGMPGVWREAMPRFLADQQHPDGRFFNPRGALNKEDDPLLATAMAVKVLRLASAGR